MNTRITITRIFFAFAFIAICKAFYMYLLPHQLLSPVLVNPMADNTYWLMYFLGIPQFILNNQSVALFFDFLLFTIPVLGFIYPSRVVFARIFSVLFFLLFLISNAFHGHGWVAILISSLLFCTKKQNNFILLFNAIRYYIAFVFISAALWKLLRGGVFIDGIMVEILKLQHLTSLIENPSSFYSSFILHLIEHPLISQGILLFAIVLQLTFIIAFRTKKYDFFLFALFFLFFLGDWIVMGISFFEFYAFGIFLYPWKSIEVEYRKLLY